MNNDDVFEMVSLVVNKLMGIGERGSAARIQDFLDLARWAQDEGWNLSVSPDSSCYLLYHIDSPDETEPFEVASLSGVRLALSVASVTSGVEVAKANAAITKANMASRVPPSAGHSKNRIVRLLQLARELLERVGEVEKMIHETKNMVAMKEGVGDFPFVESEDFKNWTERFVFLEKWEGAGEPLLGLRTAAQALRLAVEQNQTHFETRDILSFLEMLESDLKD